MTTLPGILTGVAAVLTGIAALVGVIVATDGGDGDPSTNVASRRAESGLVVTLSRRPHEGVVSDAFIALTRHGPPTPVVPRTSALWAYFRFDVLPVERLAVTTTWYSPSGRNVTGTIRRDTAEHLVEAGISRSHTPLARGTWRCVLRVGGKVVKEVSIRVKGSVATDPYRAYTVG